MPGNRALRGLQGRHNIAHAQLTREQQMQDTQPCRIRQSSKGSIRLLYFRCSAHIRLCEYKYSHSSRQVAGCTEPRSAIRLDHLKRKSQSQGFANSLTNQPPRVSVRLCRSHQSYFTSDCQVNRLFRSSHLSGPEVRPFEQVTLVSIAESTICQTLCQLSRP